MLDYSMKSRFAQQDSAARIDRQEFVGRFRPPLLLPWSEVPCRQETSFSLCFRVDMR